jgi:hypothetical protein
MNFEIYTYSYSNKVVILLIFLLTYHLGVIVTTFRKLVLLPSSGERRTDA